MRYVCGFYKPHNQDNHDGVITHTHLEPDILECEVKWALGSITTNKASGGVAEELYKKDLHDPDNHDGVITHTHLEPDILECEVKWALGSISTN